MPTNSSPLPAEPTAKRTDICFRCLHARSKHYDYSCGGLCGGIPCTCTTFQESSAPYRAPIPAPLDRNAVLREACQAICDCCSIDEEPEDWIGRSTATPAGDDGGPRFVHVYGDGSTIECAAERVRNLMSRAPIPVLPSERVSFVSEVRPDAPSPSCHVCGALMVPDGFKCLSCGANTKPSVPSEVSRETLLDPNSAPLIELIRKAYYAAHESHSLRGIISSIDACQKSPCKEVAAAWAEAEKVLLAKGVDKDLIRMNALTVPALKCRIEELEAALAARTRDEGVNVLREALEEIANPIAFMQKNAEAEGARLDGRWAVELSESANYLKEIARKALAAPSLVPAQPRNLSERLKRMQALHDSDYTDGSVVPEPTACPNCKHAPHRAGLCDFGLADGECPCDISVPATRDTNLVASTDGENTRHKVAEPPHIEDPVIAKKYVLVPRDLKCHKCGCAEPWKDPARYEVAEVLESIAVPEPPQTCPICGSNLVNGRCHSCRGASAVQKLTRTEYDNFVASCNAEPKPAPKLIELMKTKIALPEPPEEK